MRISNENRIGAPLVVTVINDTNKSMEFKTIYLLTDFSDHSKNACRYAIDAYGSSVNYLLINTVNIRSSAATLIDIEQIAHQESLESLRNEEAELRAYANNEALDIEIICKSGSAPDVINELIELINADLIVVGSKGQSKLDEILIGSVTTAIIRGVKRPVLAVPISAKFKKISQVVLASDLANSAKSNVIDMISNLKDTFDAKVSGATIKTDDKPLTLEETALLNELEQLSAIDDYSIVRNSNVSKAVMDFCEMNHADLLVVVAKHTSFFKRFFHKSVTKELVNHEILPILVLEDN